MILTGGQLGVALSYSLAPLVLLAFIQVTKNPTLRKAFISGLVLGLQILFDPRIAYITLLAVFLYLIFSARAVIKIIKSSFFIFITPLVIGILLHSYWILPLILTKSSAIPAGFDSSLGFKFFSFADFSHSFSLLHPNWPENVFGKIYFLNPEFLILPIIAFSALLFNKNKTILFFSSLALLGSFLAKGTNQPFGQVNEWLFQNFPGMVMFRDPTKWYLLIALSYSILIPYTLKEISKNFRLTVILFVLYFIYLINPIFGQIKIHQIPQEYIQLKSFLNSQKTFSRTLWIPEWQRFGYFSNNHPAIAREELFKGDAQKQIVQLRKFDTEKKLRDASVKYIILPYDSEEEMFLKDRKYDSKLYEKTVNDIRKIKWLKEINGFGKIKVFEVTDPKDHFWSPSDNLRINYSFINPTEYKVNVQNAKKREILIFSENFSKNWSARQEGMSIGSKSFNGLNSFTLPKDGNYDLEIYYSPQKMVNTGLILSILTFLSTIGYLIYPRLKRYNTFP